MCLIKARKDEEPKLLINPTYNEASEDKVVYVEGCLSLPGKIVKTVRNKVIKVSCDNWANEIEFGPDHAELDSENYWTDAGLLECVCIQHEVGHLQGELITDSHIRYKQPPMRSKKIGRNDKVMLKKGDETMYIKYKKRDKYLDEGWVVI